ncbi:MAG: hypothetical protein GY750_01905 [Lentisphaerae bacterium]|nr:hypothetical protein [Lentisphaerota bacterium]MCP4100175.1 hypothetical protein [Lentisphaerota bacterium]
MKKLTLLISTIALSFFAFADEEINSWKNLGPGGGGWYRCVAFSPHEQKLLIGGDVNGIALSTDLANFRLRNNDVTNTYIQSIKYHPTNPQIIFLGTQGGGAKSSDGGETWTTKRSGFANVEIFEKPAGVRALAIDSNNPDIIYAGIGFELGKNAKCQNYGCIYKSVDCGETWTKIISIDSVNTAKHSIRNIIIDPNDSNKLYVLTEGNLFILNFQNNQWTITEKTIPDQRNYTCLAIKRDNTNVMLLSFVNKGFLVEVVQNGEIKEVEKYKTGILKSIDGGTTWTLLDILIANQPYDSSGKGITGIVQPPSDNDTFFAHFHKDNFNGIRKTTDSGDTWSSAINDIAATGDKAVWCGWVKGATAFSISPYNSAYMCYVNDMHIYLSENGGDSWERISSRKLQKNYPDEPDFYESSGADILCATCMMIDPDNPQNMFLGYMDVAFWSTYDGGKSFRKHDNFYYYGLKNILNKKNYYGDVERIIHDPDEPNILYTARELTQGQTVVFKSFDSGETWSTPTGMTNYQVKLNENDEK